MVKMSAGLDCDAVSPLGSVVMQGVCEFEAANYSVNACVFSSRGFGGAASFSVFQLWVQEGAA